MPTATVDIENSIKQSMQPGGAFDPLGTYEVGSEIKYVHFWLEEALTQTMMPSQWEELRKLLRGGFNDEAAKLICGVAEAYARKCAADHFERQA